MLAGRCCIATDNTNSPTTNGLLSHLHRRAIYELVPPLIARPFVAPDCDPSVLQRLSGLNATSSRMVDYLSDRGLEGVTVLEIGGGLGEIQLELLRRGASTVTNLEISTSYEAEAEQLIEQSGLPVESRDVLWTSHSR
jgi:hypothetical protein